MDKVELEKEVSDILEMWLILEHRCDALSDADFLRVAEEAGAYQRMHAVFEPLRSPTGLQTTKLGATEIIEILKAIVHPERRPLLMSPSTSMVQ